MDLAGEGSGGASGPPEAPAASSSQPSTCSQGPLAAEQGAVDQWSGSLGDGQLAVSGSQPEVAGPRADWCPATAPSEPAGDVLEACCAGVAEPEAQPGLAASASQQRTAMGTPVLASQPAEVACASGPDAEESQQAAPATGAAVDEAAGDTPALSAPSSSGGGDSSILAAQAVGQASGGAPAERTLQKGEGTRLSDAGCPAAAQAAAGLVAQALEPPVEAAGAAPSPAAVSGLAADEAVQSAPSPVPAREMPAGDAEQQQQQQPAPAEAEPGRKGSPPPAPAAAAQLEAAVNSAADPGVAADPAAGAAPSSEVGLGLPTPALANPLQAEGLAQQAGGGTPVQHCETLLLPGPAPVEGQAAARSAPGLPAAEQQRGQQAPGLEQFVAAHIELGMARCSLEAAAFSGLPVDLGPQPSLATPCGLSADAAAQPAAAVQDTQPAQPPQPDLGPANLSECAVLMPPPGLGPANLSERRSLLQPPPPDLGPANLSKCSVLMPPPDLGPGNLSECCSVPQPQPPPDLGPVSISECCSVPQPLPPPDLGRTSLSICATSSLAGEGCAAPLAAPSEGGSGWAPSPGPPEGSFHLALQASAAGSSLHECERSAKSEEHLALAAAAPVPPQPSPPLSERHSLCSRSSGSAGPARPVTADASALVVCSLPPQQRPATALVPFPVGRLQSAMGAGLTAMRDRLKTAVERESNLRLETEMAAVDREELVQARVLAEAGAEAERQARLAAELELERLGVGLEEERRRAQQEVVQLHSELRASNAAVRALEKQVVSLQTKLSAEVRRREAAEAQLEQQLQRQTLPSIGCSQPTLHTLERSRPAQQQPVAAPPSRAPSSHSALSRASSGQLAALHPGTQAQPEGSPTKLPYLGRLQTDACSPTRPARTPLLHDVKQWLQSKQQEAAPWASPPAVPSPPRPRAGILRPAAAQRHEEEPQQPGGPAAWNTHMDAVEQWQSGASPPQRSRAWRQQHGPTDSPTLSASDPDSPDHRSSAQRRRQQQHPARSWTFKPAWKDSGAPAASPRSSRWEEPVAPSRVDQVLHQLDQGLEQLRQSYSPPGSPYHTSTTLPAQPVPPPQQPPMQQPHHHQQQQHHHQSPLVQGGWGFQPALAVPTVAPTQPYGFDPRPITSLLMPSLAPPATAGPSAGGGAPIIQYISTYHSPAGGADPSTRPATAAVSPAAQLQQQPAPPGQSYWPPPGGMAPFLPPVMPQQPQYAYPLPYSLPQQQQQQYAEQQRPYTPAVGLQPPAAVAYTTATAQPQPAAAAAIPAGSLSPTGVLAAGLPSRHTTGAGTVPGTARPRSPGRSKDKPLAVPPHQMDQGSLEAARLEYMLDKHRIRAKRLRELQESPDFTLGGE